MRSTRPILTTAAILVFALFCPPLVAQPKLFKVMPLGDSITEGRHGYATYRYFLWQRLLASGHCVDFVGSMRGTQGPNGVGHNGTPKYPNFDQDHEGHFDHRADELAAQAFNWASAADPDVVVCHAGSVDIFQGQTAASTAADIETLIDELRRANPDVIVLLAQIIPFGPKFPTVDVAPFNALLPALVASKSTTQSPVLLVDHYTGWNPAIHSIDDVHPNETGDDRMAATWHATLRNAIPPCRATLPKIMPLGDSITEGRHGDATYRYFLWHQLNDAGQCVDFVGNLKGTQGAGGSGHTGTPKYPDFDQDHEGHSGLRADEIAIDVFNWATLAGPDIVLCHVGSNDVFAGQSAASTVTDIEDVIDELRRANPDITILLAQIIPFGPKYPAANVAPVNALLPAFVAGKSTAQSPIHLVDHNTGWDATYYSSDDVHPNEAGMKRMAATWNRALAALNNPPCRTADARLKIMPFGDSITEAKDGDASYRYYLWQGLIQSGHCVNFVGTSNGVANGQPKFSEFDQDHEGHDGHRVDHMIPVAAGFVRATMPDLILCHIGNVDVFDQQSVASTVTEMGQLIDEFRSANPDVTVLLAQITPFGAALNRDVGPLNAALPAFVAGKTTAQSPVILVDHATGWDPALHSKDGVHPNAAGEQRMADTWHQAIANLNVACEGAFATYGQGCPGSTGVPVLAAAPGSLPKIGGPPFGMKLSSMPAGTTIIGMIGFSDRQWAGLPLPMELSVFGMPNCSLYVEPQFIQLMTASQLGSADWTLPPAPNSPTLSGLRFFVQVAVDDPGANNLGVIASNAGAGTLGVK